ncbi:MAG: YIP1 family protein, partial [Halobacteriaceae archaeon]
WVGVMQNPRKFFERVIIPGDQAPGLTFAMTVTGIYLLSLVTFRTAPILSNAIQSVLSGVVLIGIFIAIITPLVIHLLAAIQTVLLMVFIADRGSVSETVQLICYAAAPGIFMGIPILLVQIAAGVYGISLYIIGVRVVHNVSFSKAIIVGIVPASILFGYGFQMMNALHQMISSLCSIDIFNAVCF